MILRPAERAGVKFEEGLVGRILRDTGKEPGALALLAFMLDELYRRCSPDHLITHSEYEDLGAVQGAIGRRAEQAYERMTEPPLAMTSDTLSASFARVFGELVSVDESGTATRRRLPLRNFDSEPAVLQLIDAFANERMLTISDEKNPVVEVSHEAIFSKWNRLAKWIRQEQEDLILLRQMRQAAALWESKGRADVYLWVGARLKETCAMVERRNPILCDVERKFLRPEADRLLDIIYDARTIHFERSQIGDRLADIGDPRPGVGLTRDGLPDIIWCDVGEDAGFQIAKYPITYLQYTCFMTLLNLIWVA